LYVDAPNSATLATGVAIVSMTLLSMLAMLPLALQVRRKTPASRNLRRGSTEGAQPGL
jgi:hypothetical protein